MKRSSVRFSLMKILRIKTALLHFLVICFLLSSSISYAKEHKGKIVSVTDGDTVKVLVSGNKQIKVRLAQNLLTGTADGLAKALPQDIIAHRQY